MEDDLFPPRSGPLSTITRLIAVLRPEPPDLVSDAISIPFRQGHDDLDVLMWAIVAGSAGRHYALIRHIHSPEPGTELFIDSSSSTPSDDLSDALHRLGLSSVDLSWLHPDVGQHFPRDAFEITSRSEEALPRRHVITEMIDDRSYEIEIIRVGGRWRAALSRGTGIPTARMPFYGTTPAEAALQLKEWLRLSRATRKSTDK